MSNVFTLRKLRTLAAFGVGSVATAAAFVGLGAGTASADVEESAPAPYVTSRQALLVDDNALRIVDYGQARGQGGSTRSGDHATVHAQGEVGAQPSAPGGDRSDNVIAVPGTYGIPFNLDRPGSNNGFQQRSAGQFAFGPPIGSFGGAN